MQQQTLPDGRVAASTLAEILQEDLEQKTWVEHPESPFLRSARDFGMPQLTAGAFSSAVTAAGGALGINPGWLSLAAPAAEKVVMAGVEGYRALRSEDPSWSDRLKTASKRFSENVITDSLFHDPAQIALTYALLEQGVQPWLAGGVGFLAALPVAIGLQAGTGATAHRAMKLASEKMGFCWERFYETRFLVLSDQDPMAAFDQLSEAFGLSHENLSRYHDIYHRHRFPAFGNRLGLVRWRDVQDLTGGQRTYTDLELSYTFPKSESRARPEYNLHYVDKEKGWLDISEGMPRTVQRLVRPTHTELRFDRRIRYDDEIRIVHDTVRVDDARSFSLIELKAYHESPKFFEAMTYLLRHASLITTTYPKVRLVQEIRARGA